jgi:hypothetical protein
MEGKPKNRVAVIICARMWLDCDQKIRDWVKNHPNEKIVDRIPIVFTEGSGGRYCGGLMVETTKDSLASDF